jgi:hypothetical protein
MSLKNSAEIQEAIIAYLKTQTVLVNRMKDHDSAQIKELDWKGTDSGAGYPGIRVKIGNITPDECEDVTFSASIYVFSEEASSKEANEIAGIILTLLHGRGFNSTGIAFHTRVTLVSAIAQDERTWRSEAIITGRAS